MWDLEFWTRLATIVAIDLMLAGDNALVIALAVRTLPRRQQLIGRIWGAAGAIGLRVLFIAFVSALLNVPLLRLVGGLVLVWIAVKLIRQDGEDAHTVRHGTTLLEAVWLIIVADVSMSLDNVLAVAAAASGHLSLVVFGIALSVPLVVWGSGVLARLMNRSAWIVWIGGGILGYVAGEMIIADDIVAGAFGTLAPAAGKALSLGLTVALILLGWASSRRRRDAPTGVAPERG